MKKDVVWLAVLAVIAFIFFAIFIIKDDSPKTNKMGVESFKTDSFYGSITGAAIDTSDMWLAHRYMAHHFWAADTSGDDSVGVRLCYQYCTDPVTLLDWETYDSTEVTADSAWTTINITSTSRAPFPYQRTIYKGLDANKEESAVLVKDRFISNY